MRRPLNAEEMKQSAALRNERYGKASAKIKEMIERHFEDCWPRIRFEYMTSIRRQDSDKIIAELNAKYDWIRFCKYHNKGGGHLVVWTERTSKTDPRYPWMAGTPCTQLVNAWPIVGESILAMKEGAYLTVSRGFSISALRVGLRNHFKDDPEKAKSFEIWREKNGDIMVWRGYEDEA